MKIKCVKLECEVCSKLSSIQVFYSKSGEIKYARGRHYLGRVNGKPQFEYHQQSIDYIQRKLNQIPKEVNSQIVGLLGQYSIGDLDKAHSSTILEKTRASSSVRIEHQP